MNAARFLFDNIEHFGEYDKIIFEDRTITNRAQLSYACALSGALRERDIQPGDRVGVMMFNSPEVEAAFQACWMIGAVIIPITPQLGAREVGFILCDAGAKVVLTSPALEARVREACGAAPTVRHVLVDLTSEVAQSPTVSSMVDRAGSDLAVLLYTSGTTGTPKGVMLTHGSMLAGIEAISGINPTKPRHRLLLPLPMSHIYGVVMMNLCNAWGWTTILMPHFDPKGTLELIEKHKATRISMVPTMLVYLIHAPDREKYDISSLQGVLSGGASLPEPVRLEFERMFRCTVHQGYGLSESAAVATGFPFHEPYRAGSVGRPLQGIEVQIRDGEIAIRSPALMQGYWNNPGATEAAIQDGWLLTGDIGHLDEDGYLFITDRKKDLIIKGGENISPREVEEAIRTHPAVAEVSVVGIPDQVFGEDIRAAVVLRKGMHASADDICRHASKWVTKFKLPSQVMFLEALPKSPVGKVLKREIRKYV